jgi:hypothetical protein
MTRAESPMYVEIAGSVVRTVMRVCRSLVLPRCEEVFYGKTLIVLPPSSSTFSRSSGRRGADIKPRPRFARVNAGAPSAGPASCRLGALRR